MSEETKQTQSSAVFAPHQQRVVDEKRELDERIKKLTAFYSTSIFHGLPESEQSRLLRQGVAMRAYSEILGERIAAFSEV
ncbi:MAG: crAss001_48 related protein [Afipia sp.]